MGFEWVIYPGGILWKVMILYVLGYDITYDDIRAYIYIVKK